jgi:hypothetical protein
MMNSDDLPSRWPVRKVGQADWEVLVVPEGRWVSCASEEEARLLAKAPVLKSETLERLRAGTGFAGELERLAEVLAGHGMGVASRFFRRRAAEVRGPGPNPQ